jgi:hypothetical protein
MMEEQSLRWFSWEFPPFAIWSAGVTDNLSRKLGNIASGQIECDSTNSRRFVLPLTIERHHRITPSWQTHYGQFRDASLC